MAKTLLQGSQGIGNNEWSKRVVGLTEDDTLNRSEDTAIVSADAITVTLTTNPYPGLVHLIVVDVSGVPGATATVAGGAFPIVGGDQVLMNQSSTFYVFTTNDEWVPICCGPSSGEPLRPAYFLSTESADTTNDEFEDVAGLVLNFTTTQVANLDITATFSERLTLGNDQTNGSVYYRLVLDGTPLSGESGSFHSATDIVQAGAIQGAATSVAAGDHTVSVQWRVGNDANEANIQIAGDGQHGDLRVAVVKP